MAKTSARKRTVSVGGRPPSGPQGERVSRYPPLTVRIPPTTKDTLLALAAMRKTPAWRLVDEAILALVEHMPAAERRVLAQFTAKMPVVGVE